MNLWILLVMVGVVAFLVFGKNPVREFQNEQREIMKKYGDDEITIKTNMYIEQKQNEANPSSMLGAAYGIADTKKNSNAKTELDMKAAIAQSATQTDPEYNIAKPVAVAPPDADDFGEVGDIVIEQKIISDATSEIKSEEKPKSSYYPPLVTASKEVEKAPVNIVKLTGKEVKLRSGQPVLFEGVYVYTVGANGEKVPMPDGDYTLEDGGKLSVSGGYRVYKD